MSKRVSITSEQLRLAKLAEDAVSRGNFEGANGYLSILTALSGIRARDNAELLDDGEEPEKRVPRNPMVG